MLTKQRYTKILELLDKDGIVYTAELAKLMDVSSETIHKDLEYLDSRGRLSRVHGGAVPADSGKPTDIPGGYISLQIHNSQNLEQEAAITSKTAGLTSKGQVIALGYGSTSQMMALILKEWFRNLTVVTNSIQNALVLAENPGITIILTDDILNRDEYTLVNGLPSTLGSIHIDIMFVTVTGTDPVIGCTDQRLSEIRIQNQMHRSTTRTIILADSTRFGKANLLKICSFEEVDTIATGSGISPQMESRIRGAGAKLTIA